MILPKFTFHEPASIQEASELMAHHQEQARLLAGGTDLLVNMKKRLLCPGHLVSLARIAELAQLERDNGTLWIGPCVTVSAIAASGVLADGAGALCQGARALGTPQIRNRATIGGNVGSARPAADLPPPLMVYDARVELVSSTGKRHLPIAEFFKGPGMTAARPDEIIAAVTVELKRDRAGAGYLNLGVRKAQDCNIVNVASFLELDENGDRIVDARIALGSVGPTPLRARKAEKTLIGEKPAAEAFNRAAEAARLECTPILDFRGSAEYRRDMVGVLTRRTLNMALAEASASH
jgi:carbon-monoxide dehydrogenase medium subunit